jgi:hypothetical protein
MASPLVLERQISEFLWSETQNCVRRPWGLNRNEVPTVWLTQQVVSKSAASNPGIIHHCVDCGALSPPTDPERSSIGENAAWRLSRRPTLDGRLVLEWRCPGCWTLHLRAQKTG